MAGGTVLREIAESAAAIMAEPGHRFADFARIFDSFDRARAARLLNEILAEIRDARDDEGPYREAPTILGGGDFHLSLSLAGRGPAGADIVASEFDMLVVNLGGAAVEIPVYGTDIDPARIQRRPGRLRRLEAARVEPHRSRSFAAYAEIADLGAAEGEAPLLVVHSGARGGMTWVFDRSDLRPINLTANHLQASRVQVAARVLGAIGAAGDADALERLARSDYFHFVRWEAAEAVHRIDPARGARLLEEALVVDPNPAIRGAAVETLDNLARMGRRPE